jgi:hypothetical protein
MVVREGPSLEVIGKCLTSAGVGEAEALYSPACNAYQGSDQQFTPKDMTAGDDMNFTINYIIAISNIL